MQKNYRVKVLHVTEPFSGGVTTFLSLHCTHLNQFTHIICHGKRTSADKLDSINKKFSEEVRLILWKFAGREINPFKDILAIFSLLKIIKKEKPNIIHLHSSKAGFIGKILSLFFKKIKFTYTPHAPSFIRRDVSPLTRRFFLIIERFLYLLNPEIICCSKAEFDIYKLNGMKTKYINNSVEVPKQNIRKGCTNKIIIGFCGIITAAKNPGYFNEIASHFSQNENVGFRWIGAGEFKHVLNSPNIEVTGWLTDNEVKYQMEKIDLYLSCALWEGLPYSVLEAMSLSKPLLLSDIPAHKELVEQDKNGYIFRSTEEALLIIKNLIENKENLAELGNRSYHICQENYSIMEYKKLYFKYYSELLDEKLF